MFKLVLLFAFIASATSGILQNYGNYPRAELGSRQYGRLPTPAYPQPAGKVIAILRSESDQSPDGSYHYAYDTENGISVQESGRLLGSGPEAAIAATGSYQYTSPEGVPVQISYVADENGFQPSGNVLPTPPPIPAAILRSIEYNLAHPESTQTVLPSIRRYYK